MNLSRLFCAWLILFGLIAAPVQANWMIFTGGGAVSTGVWPAGSALSGTAVVNASNFVNGNISTLPIGLLPLSIGPALSTDYVATGLQPNTGNLVHEIATPYNDTGDKYHNVIDFSGTTGGSNPGVLPAGSIFAIIDLDITENYRRVFATDAANNVITTPWINGPNGYFDMNNPMIAQAFLVPNPTITGPVGGVYDMFGINYNFDVGMWLFKTTQDVKTINFDMEVGVGGNTIGPGGAGWAFYTPAGQGVAVPEPAARALACGGLVVGWIAHRRRRC